MITRSLQGTKRLWPWVAAVASGALLTLAFAPFNQGWIIWIALTPLICAVWLAARPRPFALGYVTGLTFFTSTFHWLAELRHVVSAPALLGLPPLLGAYLALYIAFWAWAIHALAPPRVLGAASSLRHLGIGVLAAALWVALEWTRGWFLTGFSWNGLGVALHRNLPMIQVAEISGVLSLTWLVAFANVMAVVIVRRIALELGPDFLRRVRWEFSGTMLIIALVFAFGARKLLHPELGQSIPLKVAAIQPNVPQDVKFDESSEDMILQKLKHLTGLGAVLQPDLILWQEAPAVRGMDADDLNRRAVLDLAEGGNFDLLIGSLDYDVDEHEPDKIDVYNAAFLLTERGARRQIYRKSHLVPFGEYMPFRKILPSAISNLVASDLQPGSKPALLQLSRSSIKVSPLICFEDSVGELTRRSCVAGAQLLVNLTNDGWFRHSAGAEQHLANAIFRTVENRRPLVRCANTGITGLVDALGREQRWQAAFAEGVGSGVVNVPTTTSLTFYARYGDWFAYLCVIASLSWLAVRIYLRRRQTLPAEV